jgi:hypothetical protein
MKQTAAIVSVVGVFLIGILVGALAMHLYHAERQTWQPVGRPGFDRHGPNQPFPSRPTFAQRLEEALDLSEEQQGEIEAIRRESREKSTAMRRELQKPVQELMEETRKAIHEVLAPEQQARFSRLSRRERRMAERFFLGQPGPGGQRGPEGEPRPRRPRR